ncbi:polysaccharide pyruvyl transferase family protein [Paenarthrobacter nicotinovorans]|uniref:polysaccharide pyruvyl transferase family protein n=1 Tax=Paenarthrobacter nicotinovorans TaxID=29320 RepID=UPI0037F6E1E2
MHSRVAIIVRTKDRGRLLGRALDSILAQTFEEWLVVLVNDGGSPSEVDQALNPRLSQFEGKIVRLDNESSVGMEAASNLGIGSSSSEFIVIHDDDDEWDPAFLETTVAHLDAHPEDGGVTVETEIVFERLTPTGREVEERVPFEPHMRAISLVDLLHYNRFVPISFLFRRSVYDELGGFDENLAVVGDWEFHLRFLIHHHVGLIKGRPLAFWNQRRSARDTEANSVIAGHDDHHFYSHQVRDRHVREYAQEFGLGPLLYQRELLASEMGRIHHRMNELQQNQAHGTERITRILEEVERLQHELRSTPEPLAIRVLNSLRRRLAPPPTDRDEAVLHPVRRRASTPGNRIAVFGDVGQRQYHVGDEAMSHATVVELRSRGFDDFVMLTHDVKQTQRLYGLPAAQRPEVPWNAYERHHLLQEVKNLLAGRPGSEAAHYTVRTFEESFAQCQALVLAGGGNLTSQYGGLLFERLAAIHVAHSMGLRILVTGQTVGPVLTDVDRAEVAEALRLCTVAGSREHHTHDLLASLGIGSEAVLDDASFFPSTQATTGPEGLPPKYIAATFAPGSGAMNRDDYYRHMARLVDIAHEQLQLPVILLPHVSTIGEGDGDQESHTAIARLAKTSEVKVLEQKSAEETAVLTRSAELVITSRYHPVIFALSNSVPVLPVAVDYYGEVRIGGALENWGLSDVLRSLRHLGDDGDLKWATAVIEARDDIKRHLHEQGQKLDQFHSRWWDLLAELLRSGESSAALPQLPVPDSRISIALESTRNQNADRLNANNELAIGLLAQDVDWQQGRVADIERRHHRVPEPTGFADRPQLMNALGKLRKLGRRTRQALTNAK